MGFNTNGENSQQTGNVRNINDKNKAHGFLNLYLPGQNGSRKKLGTIILKENTPNEKALSEWLAGEGNEELAATRLEFLLHQVEADFNLAEKAASNGFAIIDLPPAA